MCQHFFYPDRYNGVNRRHLEDLFRKAFPRDQANIFKDRGVLKSYIPNQYCSELLNIWIWGWSWREELKKLGYLYAKCCGIFHVCQSPCVRKCTLPCNYHDNQTYTHGNHMTSSHWSIYSKLVRWLVSADQSNRLHATNLFFALNTFWASHVLHHLI